MQATRRELNHFIGASVLTVLAAIVAAGVLALLMGVGAKPAEAASSGDKGKIAFASDRAGNMDIWVMNADGTNLVQLATNSDREVFPAWSPDGQKIAFVRGERGPSQEIWLMNDDGTGQKQLTFNGEQDIMPAWSPNGSNIAFVRIDSSSNAEVYVMSAAGGEEQNLTNSPDAFDEKPTWSPNGKQIAFDSDRSGAFAVHTMRSNGKYLRQLTDDSLSAFDPAWSPSGDKLAFSDNGCCGESDLFVMKADGTGVTQLFETPENETHATWSPDGKRIAFERFQVTGNEKSFVPNSGEIYVIGEHGEGLTNLTNEPGSDDQLPDWSPKGTSASSALR
jgi:TolB protein